MRSCTSACSGAHLVGFDVVLNPVLDGLHLFRSHLLVLQQPQDLPPKSKGGAFADRMVAEGECLARKPAGGTGTGSAATRHARGSEGSRETTRGRGGIALVGSPAPAWFCAMSAAGGRQGRHTEGKLWRMAQETWWMQSVVNESTQTAKNGSQRQQRMLGLNAWP